MIKRLIRSFFPDLDLTNGVIQCARPRFSPSCARMRDWTDHTTPQAEFVLTTKCLGHLRKSWRRVVGVITSVTNLRCLHIPSVQ